MTFCCVTLGCKVNQVESEAIESILMENGFKQSKAGEGCDICIINTCAVTTESVRKSRQTIRKLRKSEPKALIAVCGCLFDLKEAEAAKQLEADIVGGSKNRRSFALEIISRLSDDKEKIKQIPIKSDNTFEELPLGGSSKRTRAFLKIEDGCDNFCAYCIIPYARGKVRSLPINSAVRQAKELAAQGFREIVITGIEISSYGKDLKEDVFVLDVIEAIAPAIPGVRLRIGSLDPVAFTDEFCQRLSKIPNLNPHFHLSLQSGCDKTLMAMGRKYNTLSVLLSIEKLRTLLPECGITCDLIVGFPGETEENFNETLDFIKKAKFNDMHIFPYSERPGTKAAAMDNQISKTVRRQRAGTVKEVAQQMKEEFLISQIGRELDVLFERKTDGKWMGHSENYLEVIIEQNVSKNEIHKVKITETNGQVLIGQVTY